ncbi:ferredoxin [Buttiauxella agrestis]|nr:ferredoxin [Buttiauxella agrestis]
MKLAYSLPNFFITYTITQTNVHKHSRSNYAQSVNENSYDYNSTRMFDARDKRQKMQKKRAPKRSFFI